MHDGIKILNTDVRICQALNKCKLIAKFVRKSTLVSYFLGFVPPQSCVTRWSSDFCLIKHIIYHNDDIIKALQATNPDLIINQREIQIISEVYDVLSFFDEATDILQGQRYPTIAKVIPVIMSFENALLAFDSNSNV